MKNRAIILIVLFYTHYSNGQSSKPNDAKSDTTSKEVYKKYPVSLLYTPSTYLNKANMMIPKYDPKPPLFSIKTGNTEKVKVFLTISSDRYDYRKP